ncbi:MAG TPA: hypothetical protein VFU47_14035 [Armatimonadota bacterium]|nr:hypothetical protein [Armatimonadota bacterium]
MSEIERIGLSRAKARFRAELPASFREVVDNADRVVVYALGWVRGKRQTTFHGYRVRGRALIQSRREIVNLARVMHDSIATPVGPMACYAPHHALSFVRGEKRVDLLVCFLCVQMYAQMGGEYVWCNIDRSALPALNAALRQAGIVPYELPQGLSGYRRRSPGTGARRVLLPVSR